MYNFNVYIPSKKEKWRAKAYNTYQQKEICKVLYEEDEGLFIDTTNDIIRDCVHPQHNISNLTLLDKILLLLKVRCIAAGTTMEFESETEDQKKYTINYNFYDIYTNIHKIAVQIEPLHLNVSNFEIYCNIPSIKQENNIYNFLKTKEEITYNDILPFFIEYININNQTFNLVDIVPSNYIQIINLIPLKIIKQIEEYISFVLTKISEVTIYNIFDKKITLNIIGPSYLEYCKFIIKDNLHSIYQEIYILNKHINMSSDYIEKLTPIERDIHISSLRRENKQSSNEEMTSQTTTIPQNSNLEDIDSFKHTMGG